MDDYRVLNNTTKPNTFNDVDTRSVTVIAVEATILCIIICAAILGNLLILTAIYRFPSLRTITNVFIANLAVADLLLSFLGMPFTMVSSITYRWVFGNAMCSIQGVINSLFCEASILTLTFVSLERFIAIIYPLKYQTLVTERTMKILLCGIWTQALICATSTFWFSRFRFLEFEHICTVDWSYRPVYTFVFSIVFLYLPFLIMIVFYVLILKTALQQKRKIADITVGEIGNEACLRKPNQKSNLINFRQKRKEHKATIMIAIVVGTFSVCWFPHAIGVYCLAFSNCKWNDAFFVVTTWLAMLNSALNSGIYGLLNTSFRRAFKSVLCCGRYTDQDINTMAMEKSKRSQTK